MHNDRSLRVWLTAAVATMLVGAVLFAAIGGLLGRGMPTVPDSEFSYQKQPYPQVNNPGFSLNGADYPMLPVLQDFIDRNWVPDGVAEVIGDYSEKDGPTNLTAGGYKLVREESQIKVLLNMDDCKNGVHPTERRVRGLSFRGTAVTSFCIGGQELAAANQAQLVSILGEPDATTQYEQGIIYIYSDPERGIKEFSFSFTGADTPATQIIVAFEENVK